MSIMPRTLKPKPTKEEILAIEGSVPVEMAARYLGRPKDFIYNGLQKQALPIGTAYIREKEWCYDIRPQALVEYNEHGGIMQHTEFEHFVRAVITNAAKNVVDMAVFGEY
jgi:hypothetical protein